MQPHSGPQRRRVIPGHLPPNAVGLLPYVDDASPIGIEAGRGGQHRKATLSPWGQTIAIYTGGFVVLLLSAVFFAVSRRTFLDERILGPPALSLGMLLITMAGCRASGQMQREYGENVTFVWWGLMLWSIVTIVRGITLDRHGLYMWGIPLYAWAWLVPVCMPLAYSLRLWSRMLRICTLSVLLGVGAWLFSIAIGTTGSFGLLTVAPFLAVFMCYLPDRLHKVVWVGAFLCMFTAVLISGRTLVFGAALMILAGIWIAAFKRGPGGTYRRTLTLTVLSVVIIAISTVATMERVPFVPAHVQRRLDTFKEELPENSRTKGRNLYADFLDDVTGVDRLIGRGCMGTYRGWRGKHGFDWKNRRNVECGYFQIILKGGVVMLVLTMLLMVPSAILGLFFSRNWFARGCAAIVWVRFGEMIVFGLPCADLRYLFVWMAVGACLSRRIRQMPEDEVSARLAEASMPSPAAAVRPRVQERSPGINRPNHLERYDR